MKCTLVERDARFWDADAGTARKDATFFFGKGGVPEKGEGGGGGLERLERLDKGIGKSVRRVCRNGNVTYIFIVTRRTFDALCESLN